MPRKLRVGVIFGGRSGEHEVSLVSAASVMKALDPAKYEVVPIGISKEGRWIVRHDALDLLKNGALPPGLRAVLPADPTEPRLLALRDEKRGILRSGKSSVKPVEKLDVVFPVLHGPYGEDGTIQGLLELAHVPYVGAGVLASAIGMDKVVQKQLFERHNLPVAPYVWFLSQDWQREQERWVKSIETRLRYPCFIKPANLGSSVGITKAHNRGELLRGIEEAAQYDRKILVEKGIENAREIEVSVLGNEDPQASVPGEVIPSNEFYDYDAKYVDGKSQLVIPAQLPPRMARRIREVALRAFKAIDAAGMARVDFLVTRGTYRIYICEVNTIPGFTAISMYPKLWEASGLPYSKLVERLIELAIERHREKSRLKTSYQPKAEWYKG